MGWPTIEECENPTNASELTLQQWIDAAGGAEVLDGIDAKQAWLDDEDPAEYKADDLTSIVRA